jgi:hypothetical protein
LCAGASSFREVGWPSRSVGHARCKHRETDKPIGKPVIVFPMDPWLRVAWPFPLVLPGRSPPRRWLATCAARLRFAGRAFEDSASVVRRNRLPGHAHPPWPLPPLRSLHPCPGRAPAVETTTARRPPLLGFVGTPLHRRARGFGPASVAAVGTSRDATPGTLPLTWFCTTSADCRPLESQAYCSLLPILGFVAFPCVPLRDRTSRSLRSTPFPRRRFVPLEESPRR